MAARQELHSGLSEMATQTQNYKLHKFELKDAPADITAINASMDIIDTQLKALADGKFDKTGGTISGNLVVNGSTTLKKLTASELDLNGNADVSGTLKVAGATTLTGKLTANGGVTTKALTATNLDLNGNGDVSGSLTVHGDLNAQGGLNVSDITATGATTLVNLNAANITATGTLKVNGATTLTGLLAANGGVTTKKVTATELDLNGNGDVSGNLNVGGLLQVTGIVESSELGVFRRQVRIRDERLTKGTIPSTNAFSQVYFGDKNAATVSDLSGIFGFLEMGVRSDGRTDLKMVALRNEANSDNSYSANLSVGWYQYGDEWAARATAPTPHENSTGSEIVTVAYGTNHYLKRDGSNRITADGLIWEKATSGGYFTFLRRVNDADASASVGSSQDHFVISGFNQGTIICSGETGGNLESIAKIIAAMEHPESIVLAADRNLEIFTNCGNEADMAAAHKHVFKSNGNVQFGGTFVIEDSSLSHHFLMRNSSLIKGTFPETAQYFDIAFVQNAGDATTDRFGAITTRVNPDGSTFTQLLAYKNQAGVNTSAYLGVGFDEDGNSYTYAPAPVTESNDNSIATTKWVRDLLLSAVPTGTILPFAGKTVPSGFLSCNKANVSRTTYAKLFSIIGTTYGSGDGSTTFTLPDYRNRFVMGANTASEVGTYLESGAPNITGSHGGHAFKYGDRYNTEGAYYGTDTSNGGAGDGGNTGVYQMGFDASLCNPIYGASDTIQPPAGKALWIIKT